nr:M23 family metallopeptidase [Muribaculaceae bacterium]
HLSSIVDFSLPAWSVGGVLLLTVVAAVAAGAAIVLLTPLHTLLPGYLKEDQRAATEENLLRLDSLHNLFETKQRYIDNYLRVLDTDRTEGDSAALNTDTVPMTADSLILPSNRERRFVARMEEQERYNISVLAPLAADGMVFSNVSDTGVFTSASKNSERAEIILPTEATVTSVAEGTVIAAYYSPPEKGYVVIIQHPRGFVTRLSHLGNPFVVMDESVSYGQVIASPPPPDRKGKSFIYIRMWHNGHPVIPYKFIHSPDPGTASDENSFEAPRGR